MGGSFNMTRAMATLCFCPPLSCVPRGPTSVFNPSGNASVKWVTCAALAASQISSSLASGRPNLILSEIDPENKRGSWLTTPICSRKIAGSISIIL
mmetsp:Transcript_22202/g.39921  ORF Transcript_22202/g.39921 Transcript_22202/m.39921 type:complete len:96 (+) Transcript_22202:305-592(+)